MHFSILYLILFVPLIILIIGLFTDATKIRNLNLLQSGERKFVDGMVYQVISRSKIKMIFYSFIADDNRKYKGKVTFIKNDDEYEKFRSGAKYKIVVYYLASDPSVNSPQGLIQSQLANLKVSERKAQKQLIWTLAAGCLGYILHIVQR